MKYLRIWPVVLLLAGGCDKKDKDDEEPFELASTPATATFYGAAYTDLIGTYYSNGEDQVVAVYPRELIGGRCNLTEEEQVSANYLYGSVAGAAKSFEYQDDDSKRFFFYRHPTKGEPGNPYPIYSSRAAGRLGEPVGLTIEAQIRVFADDANQFDGLVKLRDCNNTGGELEVEVVGLPAGAAADDTLFLEVKLSPVEMPIAEQTAHQELEVTMDALSVFDFGEVLQMGRYDVVVEFRQDGKTEALKSGSVVAEVKPGQILSTASVTLE